jgi:hypothetical protein
MSELRVVGYYVCSLCGEATRIDSLGRVSCDCGNRLDYVVIEETKPDGVAVFPAEML